MNQSHNGPPPGGRVPPQQQQMQQNYHHHHQQMTDGSSDNSVHLIYVDRQVMTSNEQCGTPPIAPPSSWVKPQQQYRHNNTADNSTSSFNYGASYPQPHNHNTSTKEGEQQCRYGEGSSSYHQHHRGLSPSAGGSEYDGTLSFYTGGEQQHPPGEYYPHPQQSCPQPSQDHTFQQEDDNYYGSSTNWGQPGSVDYNVEQQQQCSSRYQNSGTGFANCPGRTAPGYDPLMAAGSSGATCSSPHLHNHGDYQQQKQQPFRRSSLDSAAYPGGGQQQSHQGSMESIPSDYGGHPFCGGGPQFTHPSTIKREGWNSSTGGSGAEGDYYYGGQQQRQFSSNFTTNSCRMAGPPSNYYNSRTQRHHLRQCSSFDQTNPTTRPNNVGLLSTCQLKPGPVKQRSLSLQQYSTTNQETSSIGNYEPEYEIPEIDPSAYNSCNTKLSQVTNSPSLLPPRESTSPSSSCVGGSSDEESNYPGVGECSTTVNSDSVMTLHAGGDDNEMGNEMGNNCCEYSSQFGGQDELLIPVKSDEHLERVESTSTLLEAGRLPSDNLIETESIKSEPPGDGETNEQSAETSTTPLKKNQTWSNVTSTTKSELRSSTEFVGPSTTNVNDKHLKNDECTSNDSLVRANLARFEELISESGFYDSESLCSLPSRPAPPTGKSPGKIIKRSLSEADKEVAASGTSKSLSLTIGVKEVAVPAGWRRETSSLSSDGSSGETQQQQPIKTTSSSSVYYVSPSGTLLHTWDELKQYITSSGTCKCGLGCPVRIEEVFNFEPEVLSSLHHTTLVTDQLSSIDDAETRCSHNKRKLSEGGHLTTVKENSPLISSTRDDLGDQYNENETRQLPATSSKSCAAAATSSKKKRRTDTNPEMMTTTLTIPQLNTSLNQSVPQQSPDTTTTTTPQPSTSPTSSVSSEPSGGGGVRSSPNSTTLTKSSPTPSLPTLAPQVWTEKKLGKVSRKPSEPCPNVNVRELLLLVEGGPAQSFANNNLTTSSAPPTTSQEPESAPQEGVPAKTKAADQSSVPPPYPLYPALIPTGSNALANILPIQFPLQQRVLPTEMQVETTLIVQKATASNLCSAAAAATTATEEPLESPPKPPAEKKSPLDQVKDIVNRVAAKPVSESVNDYSGANQNEDKDAGSGVLLDSNAGLVPPNAGTSSGVTAITPTMASILSCSAPTGALTINTVQQGVAQQQQLRYPFFSAAAAMQPIFLNQAGNNLIISQQQQTTQLDQTNFLQFDPGQLTPDLLSQMLLDPTLSNILTGKKKKKRPSKKQLQQQQQLQQQLILQQIQQQIQQQQSMTQLIFPQSYQLGSQLGQLGGSPAGFSLQPLNYYQTPTILTLPNLILNPADGTLYLQQAAASGIKYTAGQLVGQQSVIAPRKECSSSLTPDSKSSEHSISLDDSRQQSATPDSSTNDLPNFVAPSMVTPSIVVPHQLGSISPGASAKKVKSKAVSSSSNQSPHQKRILPQKQILPKIDSTTSTTDGG